MRRFASNLRALQLFLAFASVILTWPVLVGAQSLKVGITPDRFEFVASAGETVHGQVKFTNGSNSPLSLRTEVIDFLPDGEDGKIAVDGVNDPLHSLTTWVALRQSELTVGPLMSAPVDFEIRVPAEAAAGAHWGVLVFRDEGTFHVGAIILLNVQWKCRRSCLWQALMLLTRTERHQ